MVWRALTDPKLLATLLMDNDMRPLVGQSFTFEQADAVVGRGCALQGAGERSPQAPSLFVAERSGVLAFGHRGHLDAGADAFRRHALTLEHSGFVPTNAAAFEGAR